MASPFDPSTKYAIIPSETPVTVDGYSQGEPKILSCKYCDASALITEERSDPGVDDLPHEKDCPQRFARSEWWRARFEL